LAIENQVFLTDRMSARSLRRLLGSATAAVIAAECGARLAGYGLVLFRRTGTRARLYSIAVTPDAAGRGIGRALLVAAEAAASAHGCCALRLEVDTRNTRARQLYVASGYVQIRTLDGYYQDGGQALRLEKRLDASAG
jgi:ribosomal protein S18 acetylase RimI-like enzyme